MQDLVDTIITKAQLTGDFAGTSDKLIDETDKFPFFAVGDRRSPTTKISEDGKLYDKRWTYECFILVDHNQGYRELERVANNFLDTILDNSPSWKIEDEYHYQSTIMGRDVLAARITISNLRKIEYQ
jgi:hypothetical protein